MNSRIAAFQPIVARGRQNRGAFPPRHVFCCSAPTTKTTSRSPPMIVGGVSTATPPEAQAASTCKVAGHATVVDLGEERAQMKLPREEPAGKITHDSGLDVLGTNAGVRDGGAPASRMIWRMVLPFS